MQKSVNFLELIGGGKIPEVLIGTWIVMGILLVFGFVARASLAGAADPIIPDEGISRALGRRDDRRMARRFRQRSHRDARVLARWSRSSACIFMFILFANFFGLIPGMEPPTGDSDLTFALGSSASSITSTRASRRTACWYLRSFLGPYLPLALLMLPIEMADNLFRPFSLGVRLYANMFADHTVLSIFTGLTQAVRPAGVLRARLDRVHHPGDHLHGSFDELRATRRKPRSLGR